MTHRHRMPVGKKGEHEFEEVLPSGVTFRRSERVVPYHTSIKIGLLGGRVMFKCWSDLYVSGIVKTRATIDFDDDSGVHVSAAWRTTTRHDGVPKFRVESEGVCERFDGEDVIDYQYYDAEGHRFAIPVAGLPSDTRACTMVSSVLTALRFLFLTHLVEQ